MLGNNYNFGHRCILQRSKFSFQHFELIFILLQINLNSNCLAAWLLPPWGRGGAVYGVAKGVLVSIFAIANFGWRSIGISYIVTKPPPLPSFETFSKILLLMDNQSNPQMTNQHDGMDIGKIIVEESQKYLWYYLWKSRKGQKWL